MIKVGPHVSTTGGVENAPANAAALGATGFGMFTRNQRQWTPPPYPAGAASAFAAAMSAGGFDAGAVLPHAGYLINLASPDDSARERSIAALEDEVRRCMALGLDRINIHPGSSLGKISREEADARVADAINRVLAATEGVAVVIEDTAGQGSYLGAEFEEVAAIAAGVEDQGRIGFCLDTAHMYAAGHDVAGADAVRRVLDRFDAVAGISRLMGFHLNDTNSRLGSHLDRHAPLGTGALGWETFEALARDPRLAAVPFVIETPDESLWPSEISRLLDA